VASPLITHDNLSSWGTISYKNPIVREKESEKMTLSEYYHRNVPEYYDWMYLDGYTPEQIMYAKRK
jgi:hypothetical protein